MPDASDGAAVKTEAAPDEHALSAKITTVLRSRIEAGKRGRFGGLVPWLVACSL